MRNAARLFIALFCLASAAARAADLDLEARLIWGTNDEKGGPHCKPMDASLTAHLNRMFKWKSYFEITNKCASIPINKTRDLKMSDRCTLRIKNLGGCRVEVSCIGEGKQVEKGEYTLAPPKWLVLGGNDKNNTAWFIGLRSSGAKIGEAISKN